MRKAFLIAFVAMTSPTWAETPDYMPKEKPYPCIADYTCKAGGEFYDTSITQISVDYYDDLGTPFQWTHDIHRAEDRTDCQKAMIDLFPYAFFKRCETSES